MFEIRIDYVSAIYGKVTVSGKCVNRKDFVPKLFDDNGTEFVASIPFLNYVVMPDRDYTTLELIGVQNPDMLKGRVLRSIATG